MRLHPLSARPAYYNSCSHKRKEKKRKEWCIVQVCCKLEKKETTRNAQSGFLFSMISFLVNIQDDIKPYPFISPQSSPTSYPVPYPITHLTSSNTTAYRPNNASLDLPPCFFLSLPLSKIIPPYLLPSLFTLLFIPISKPTHRRLCQPFPQLRGTYIPIS